MDTNKVKIKIAGANYTILSDKSEHEVKEIAEYVDEEINKILNQNYRYNATMAATLVALNVSNDYFDLKKQLDLIEDSKKMPIIESEKLFENSNKLKNDLKKSIEEYTDLKKQYDTLLNTLTNIEKRYEKLELNYYDSFNDVKIRDKKIMNLQNEIIKIKDEYINKLKK